MKLVCLSKQRTTNHRQNLVMAHLPSEDYEKACAPLLMQFKTLKRLGEGQLLPSSKHLKCTDARVEEDLKGTSNPERSTLKMSNVPRHANVILSSTLT